MEARDKLNIRLYQSIDGKSEDLLASQAKTVERFMYVFKVLLKASHKKEAVFNWDSAPPKDAKSRNKRSGIAFIIIHGDHDKEMEAYRQFEASIGKEKIFLICFDKGIYDRFENEFPIKIYPVFHHKTNGEILTFIDFFVNNTQPENDLFLKVFDLIDSVNERLSEANSVNAHENMIYLALTENELNEERNILKRELRRLGYQVTPGSSINGEYNSDERLKEEIEKSKLSIHLLHSEDYATGMDQSLTSRQKKLTLEKYKDSPDYTRIFWLSGNGNGTTNNSVSVDGYKEKSEGMEGAEVLQNSIETLRGLLKNRLNANDQSSISNGNDQSSKRSKVYFLYDKVDERHALQLIGKTNLKGQDILKPVFKGDFHQLRSHHIKCLQDADRVIVFAQDVNPVWIKMKYLEILKSPGMGRKKKWQEQVIYLGRDQETDWLSDKNKNWVILRNDIEKLVQKIGYGKKELSNERIS